MLQLLDFKPHYFLSDDLNQIIVLLCACHSQLSPTFAAIVNKIYVHLGSLPKTNVV